MGVPPDMCRGIESSKSNSRSLQSRYSTSWPTQGRKVQGMEEGGPVGVPPDMHRGAEYCKSNSRSLQGSRVPLEYLHTRIGARWSNYRPLQGHRLPLEYLEICIGAQSPIRVSSDCTGGQSPEGLPPDMYRGAESH